MESEYGIDINKNTNPKLELKVSFDTKGNLYFEHNNRIYQVEIDKNKCPELVEADYSIVEESKECSKTKIGGLICLNSDETRKQLEEPEYEEQIIPGSIPLSMYPEEAGYLFTNDRCDSEDPLDCDLDDSSYFCFSGTGYEVHERKNGYYNALYDTFIENDGNVRFRTKLIGEPPLYVLIVDGTHIKFRDTSTLDVYKRFEIKEIDNLLKIQPY